PKARDATVERREASALIAKRAAPSQGARCYPAPFGAPLPHGNEGRKRTATPRRPNKGDDESRLHEFPMKIESELSVRSCRESSLTAKAPAGRDGTEPVATAPRSGRKRSPCPLNRRACLDRIVPAFEVRIFAKSHVLHAVQMHVGIHGH